MNLNVSWRIVKHPDQSLRYRVTCKTCGVWNVPTEAEAVAAFKAHSCEGYKRPKILRR